MEIGVAVGDLLGERQRIAGLDEHMEPPALHLGALVVWGLDYLGHQATVVRLFLDEPSRVKFALFLPPNVLFTLRARRPEPARIARRRPRFGAQARAGGPRGRPARRRRRR